VTAIGVANHNLCVRKVLFHGLKLLFIPAVAQHVSQFRFNFYPAHPFTSPSFRRYTLSLAESYRHFLQIAVGIFSITYLQMPGVNFRYL
jgi:hypothetical protein